MCVFCALGVVIGILRNFVFESLYPSAISLLSLVTVTLPSASHSCAADISVFPANMVNLCDFLVFWGIFSMSNSHSDVAFILVPSGCVAFNPFIVCVSNVHGLSVHKQCVVVPLSTIASVTSAVFSGVCIVV